MALFRKKPMVVEAVQWFKMGDHPAVHLFSYSDGYQPGDWFPSVSTSKGPQRVQPGDWIITGVNGEHYPCKPDVFTATYERVDVETDETV